MSNGVELKGWHRVYAAQLGRFVSRDPVRYKGSKWNLCEYANSSPAVHGDSSGLAPRSTPFLYGHFCGFSRAANCSTGNIGTKVPLPPPNNPKPKDALDRACAIHDCCLDKLADVVLDYCLGKRCNKTFCTSIKAVNCDQIDINDPLAAYECNRMKKTAQTAFCPGGIISY